jgi:hypothetical protein
MLIVPEAVLRRIGAKARSIGAAFAPATQRD